MNAFFLRDSSSCAVYLVFGGATFCVGRLILEEGYVLRAVVAQAVTSRRSENHTDQSVAWK